MYPEVTIASPHKDGKSVNKQKTEEGAGQKECAERQAEWPRALLGGARLTSHEPCISRCLSPGCLHPFPLACSSPARSFGSRRSSPSWRFAVGKEHLLSLNGRPSSCLPLSNRVNTFLFCCVCQHTSNLLAAGASPVLVLAPFAVCPISLPSGLETCQPGFLQIFLTLGCDPREYVPCPLGLKPHHHLMPASLPPNTHTHTSHWAALVPEL